MIPTIGRIVHYTLTVGDASDIHRRRTSGQSIAARLEADRWPAGAQAHIGNPTHAGAVLPMIIVAVWPDEFGPGAFGVNGQVFLDGNDQLWITSAREGDKPGEWQWPPRG